METSVKEIIRQMVINLIDETINEKNINKVKNKHLSTVHFIPLSYRIISGLLQSLNIKFGNLLEQLLHWIIEQDDNLELILPNTHFYVHPETVQLIDQYITDRADSDATTKCDEDFSRLLQTIVSIEQNTSQSKTQKIKYDVDVLFKLSDSSFIYLEVKYNDDHDSGKFVDINRKLLKTYAGLVSYLNITTVEMLKPCLYYFNPTKETESRYMPSSHIYRGQRLFDEYFETSFSLIDGYLREIGNDEQIIAIFDNLYQKIRYDL